jgi:hypothetical protein
MIKSLKECGVTLIHLKEVTGRAIEEARPAQSCTKQLLLQCCNCIHTLKSTTVDLKKKRTNAADIEEAQHESATHTLSLSLFLQQSIPYFGSSSCSRS